MPFEVRRLTRPTSGLDGTVIVLESSDRAARAEVWPAGGLNCYRWQLRHGELSLDLIYADPRLFLGARPTGSGFPILFPFPNRIRDGRFRWDGREYQLPRNDRDQRNAIHGFTCFRPWTVVDEGADGDSAWVTAAFRGSVDAPDMQDAWPADYELQVTYRLLADRLRVEARARNPDTRPLPFGLGYHPYFRIPLVPNSSARECFVQALADERWELESFLPTGARRPADEARGLTVPRRFDELTLDDVFSGLSEPARPWEGLRLLGLLRQPLYGVELRLLASAEFRELVLFTPVHRQAICLEPYTCTTDAVNLQARGIDAGWRVLAPGQEWAADVVHMVSLNPCGRSSISS
jgi:aldose 1-epimerase